MIERHSSYRIDVCSECKYAAKCLRENRDVERCQEAREKHIAFIITDPHYLRCISDPWKHKFLYAYDHDYKKKGDKSVK